MIINIEKVAQPTSHCSRVNTGTSLRCRALYNFQTGSDVTKETNRLFLVLTHKLFFSPKGTSSVSVVSFNDGSKSIVECDGGTS